MEEGDNVFVSKAEETSGTKKTGGQGEEKREEVEERDSKRGDQE